MIVDYLIILYKIDFYHLMTTNLQTFLNKKKKIFFFFEILLEMNDNKQYHRLDVHF